MIEQWVKDLTEECISGEPLSIGITTKHPDGRKVKIVDGQYWGTYGLSNFWYWQEILEDGSLSETTEHGYGWYV